MATRSTRTIDQVDAEAFVPFMNTPAPTSNPMFLTADQYVVQELLAQNKQVAELRAVIEMLQEKLEAAEQTLDEKVEERTKNLCDIAERAKECEELAHRREELFREAAQRIAEKILEVTWSVVSKSPCITTTTHCFFSAFDSDKEIFRDFVRVFALGEKVDKLYEEHAPESDEIAAAQTAPAEVDETATTEATTEETNADN